MMPEIIPYGDRAILINFEQKIDRLVNQKVIGLSKRIAEANIKGFQSCIPAYCSLTILFDHSLSSFQEIKTQIQFLIQTGEVEKQTPIRKLKIPVCYGGEYSPDLEEVSKLTSLSVKEIIELHTNHSFQVYMIGFLPGFAYMGKLPPELFVSRKTSPRLKVAAGSVGLAGFQTGIYPSEAPGGWQLIGQTPLQLFNSSSKPHFLFRPGDEVQFSQIDEDDFLKIKEEIAANKYDLTQIINC